MLLVLFVSASETFDNINELSEALDDVRELIVATKDGKKGTNNLKKLSFKRQRRFFPIDLQ